MQRATPMGLAWIVPIFQVAVFADVAICKLIKAWSKDTVDIHTLELHDGTRVLVQSSAGGREAILTMSHEGTLIGKQHVLKVSAGDFEIRDASSGTLTGKVRKTETGDVRLADPNGRIVRTLASNGFSGIPDRVGNVERQGSDSGRGGHNQAPRLRADHDSDSWDLEERSWEKRDPDDRAHPGANGREERHARRIPVPAPASGNGADGSPLTTTG